MWVSEKPLKDLENLLLLQIMYSRRQCNIITCLGLRIWRVYKVKKILTKLRQKKNLKTANAANTQKVRIKIFRPLKKYSSRDTVPINNTPHNANYVTSPAFVTVVMVRIQCCGFAMTFIFILDPGSDPMPQELSTRFKQFNLALRSLDMTILLQ